VALSREAGSLGAQAREFLRPLDSWPNTKSDPGSIKHALAFRFDYLLPKEIMNPAAKK